jgi:hypothetical protein
MNTDCLEHTIYKPLPNGSCSIDKRILTQAKRNHQMIRLTVIGYGTVIVDPQEWWDTAYKKEKRVVRYVNDPMVFAYNYPKYKGLLKARKDIVVDQLSLL